MSARSRAHPWFGPRKPWPGVREQTELIRISPVEQVPMWAHEYVELPGRQTFYVPRGKALIMELSFGEARAVGVIDLQDEKPHGWIEGFGR